MEVVATDDEEDDGDVISNVVNDDGDDSKAAIDTEMAIGMMRTLASRRPRRPGRKIVGAKRGEASKVKGQGG